MVQSWSEKKRREAAVHFYMSFIDILDKKQAWNDLHHLTLDKKTDVREAAVRAIGSAFPHIPDKDQAWDDLLRLTLDKKTDVREAAVRAIGSAFPHIPDKDQACWALILLIQDIGNEEVQRVAAKALGAAFPHIPDKKQAGDDLHRLTQVERGRTQRSVAEALGAAFPYIPDKKQAGDDLHHLTQVKGYFGCLVQEAVAEALGAAFPYIPDKKQAGDDLHHLTQVKGYGVQKAVVKALGDVFPHIPDKKQASDDLTFLSQNKKSFVRLYANYFLGKASIFKATEVESEEEFRKELEKALEFFEKSSKDKIKAGARTMPWEYHGFNYLHSLGIHLFGENPAHFCLPFYNSYYTVVFKKNYAEAELSKFLDKARTEVGSSENKRKLLEIIENLSNALKEAQNAQEIDFKTMKYDLNAYRGYIEHAVALLETTEEKSPRATKLIRKGLPIIDETIKEIIAEIQEQAKTSCQQSTGTPTEEITCAVNQEVQKWYIADQEQMTRNIENLFFILKVKIPITPENKYIHDEIEEIKKETDITKQYEKVPLLIGLIPTAKNIVEKGGVLIMGDVFKNIQNATIINKAVVIDSFNKVKKEHDEDVANALLKIGEFIEKSGDVSAGILFDKFNEELNKSNAEKSTLIKIWDGIEKTLPSIKALSAVIAKLSPLF